MMDFDCIVDANWITTILSMSFGLYIFVLGIPTLILQTFIPEEIRELYNRVVLKGDIIGKKWYWVVILFLIVVIENHGLIEFILKHKNIHVGLYLLVISLLAFILSVIFSIKIVEEDFTKFKNLHKSLTKHVFEMAFEKYCSYNGYFQMESIEDLHSLANYYESRIDTHNLLESTKRLVTNVIEYSRYPYDGKKLINIIEDVANETLNKPVTYSNKRCLSIAIDISKIIKNKCIENNIKSDVDLRAVRGYMFAVGIRAVELEFDAILTQVVDFLFDSSDGRTDILRLCNKELELKKFSISIYVIKNYMSVLNKQPNQTHITNYIIAHLSSINSLNSPEGRLFVEKILKSFSPKNLSEKDFENAIKNFSGEFLLCDNIQNIKKIWHAISRDGHKTSNEISYKSLNPKGKFPPHFCKCE